MLSNFLSSLLQLLRFYIIISAYDTKNKDELKAGFKSLQCGSHISLWTTTPSESTTTTTSKPKTDTSRITIPSTQTTAKTASVVTTESATNSSTDKDSVSSIGVENVSPRNQAVESTASKYKYSVRDPETGKNPSNL